MKKWVKVADDPIITDDCISTQVTLPENGISSCIISANDDKGKNYLAHYKLFDEVTIKYAYDEDNPDWDTIKPVFTGQIIELVPSMSRTGEVVSVTAMSIGFCLKQMRVAEEYGLESHIITVPDVINSVGEWHPEESNWIHNGVEPWINGEDVPGPDNDWIAQSCASVIVDLLPYSFTDEHIDWTVVGTTDRVEALNTDDDIKYLRLPAKSTSVGGYDEAYGFADLSEAVSIDTVNLYVKGRLKDGAGGHATGVTVRFYIWNGIQWYSGAWTFTSTDWELIPFNFSILDTMTKVNNAKLKILFEAVEGGGDDKGFVEITYAYLHVEGTKIGLADSYYTFDAFPVTGWERFNLTKLELHLKGQLITRTANAQVYAYLWYDDAWHYVGNAYFETNDYVDVSIDISELGLTLAKLDTTKLKLTLGGYTLPAGGTVRITWAYIKWSGHLYGPSILRDIMTDTNIGIIPKYVEKILNTVTASGYALNTDYVYNDLLEYSYLNFPYQDTFMCVQDLIRLGSSLHYKVNPSNWKGLHWMIDTEGNLLIAPVGNHHVEGLSGKWVDSIWDTYVEDMFGNVLDGSVNPDGSVNALVVKQDMITQNFKTEIPLANYVLVAGKYINPINDIWTESLIDWEFQCSTAIAWTTLSRMALDMDFAIIGASIKTTLGRIASGAEWQAWNVFWRPLNTEFLNLITRDSSIKFAFAFASGGNTENWTFRLLVDKSHYIEYSLSAVSGHPNEFIKFEPEITADTLKGVDSKWILVSKYGSGVNEGLNDNLYDWNNIWDDIGYLGFHFTEPSGLWEADCWVDDIMVIGNIIRGAYDSTSIKSVGEGGLGHKCRFLTIKDSLASTDSLDPNNDNSPLAQLALYELLRNRIIRTSGQISIPLDPSIMPGQLVYIRACYDEANNIYRINKLFRITEVKHSFIIQGATTLLKLVDDLVNSIPIDTMDPYTITMRAINPDYQTRTYASLKTSGDFVTLQKPISKDYPS